MFSIYSVAVILLSPIVGKIVGSIGNTNMITIGIATMGFAFIAFGAVPKVSSVNTLLTLGFTLRFIQGGASAFVQTTTYSIATNDFPEKKEQVVGWVEAITGLGLIIGPIIGSILYSLLGYTHTFYIYGSFLVFLSFIVKLNFPEGDSTETEDDNFNNFQSHSYNGDEISSFKNESVPTRAIEALADRSEDDLDIQSNERVTLTKLICTARFTMAALSSALVYFSYTFLEPILAPRLVKFDLT